MGTFKGGSWKARQGAPFLIPVGASPTQEEADMRMVMREFGPDGLRRFLREVGGITDPVEVERVVSEYSERS